MSAYIVSMPQGECPGDLYSVRVDGCSLPLHKAYVSAVPYNRRWPGHQRPVDQREEVNFGGFSMDGPVNIEIIPTREFRDVVVRPLSLGIVPSVENGVIHFTLEKPAYFTVELDGYHHALHLFADAVETYADVDKTSADVLYFGPGVHETDVLLLHSGQTVFVDEGAVVYCKGIAAYDSENIRILGRGILDNSRNVEKIIKEVPADGTITECKAVLNEERTHFIQFGNCKNIVIDGVTLRDSLLYNISPDLCVGLEIRHTKLIGNWRYNSDGIDMHNCKNIHISDCFIRTYDDCICAKGFFLSTGFVRYADFDVTVDDEVYENLTVERCVLWNDWNCAMEVGANTCARHIRNIVWRDCDIIHGSASLLDINDVDYAEIYNWIAEDIRCEYDEPAPTPMYQWTDAQPYEPHYEKGHQPMLFSAVIQRHHEYSRFNRGRGRIHGVTLRNIKINGPRKPVLHFEGYDEQHLCEDITVDGIWRDGVRLTEADLDIRKNEFAKNIRFL